VYTSEKTKGAIKRNWQHMCTRQRKPKGQSRETGNMCVHVRENQRGNQEKLATYVYTRQRTKINQSKKHNTENQNDEQHGPHQQSGMNPGACEGQAPPVSHKTLI
jgi:sarcosine oxidase delta subunit